MVRHRQMLRRTAVGTIALALGCGGGDEHVRPRAPAAEGVAVVALSGPPRVPTHTATGDAKPFLLGNEPSADPLVAAMARGVAIVRYDASGLELLQACKGPGSYGFMGQKPASAEVVVRGWEEIVANFPRSALDLFGSQRFYDGTTPARVRTTIIGTRATTLPVVPQSHLVGDCAGATHFVRTATIGSFVLDPAGGHGNVLDPTKACAAAQPSAREPLAGCDRIISAHVVPIGEASPFREAVRLAIPRPACPDGLVRVGLVCVVSTGAPFQCAPDDAGQCEHQCERGHAGSCARHAMTLYSNAKSDRAAVVKLYEKACAQGELAACENLAWMRVTGDGTAKDEAAAAELFTSTCDAGAAHACSNLAAMYSFSWRGHTDRKKSFELDERACNGGAPGACANLGVYYEHGREGARSHATALAIYLRACEGGDAGGCGNAGELLSSPDSDLPSDLSRARELLARACDHGDGEGCTALGQLTVDARIAPGGPDEAAALFTRGCDRGSGDGCARLGQLLLAASWSKRDPVRARTAFERGCDRGDGGACEGLASMMLAGEGGAKDEPGARRARERALRAFETSCDASWEMGCWGLANATRFGLGMTRDAKAAATKHTERCTQGHQRSCTSLAEMLATGEGLPRDAKRAAALAHHACEKGVVPACALPKTATRNPQK